MILGDEDVSSIFGKTHTNVGVTNSFPEDGINILNDILVEIDRIFPGTIMLAQNFNDFPSLENSTLENVDGIYFLNIGRVSDSEADIQTYTDKIAVKLDEILEPNLVETGKLVWMGLDYPSIISAYTGCVELSGVCTQASVLNYPSPAQPDLITSLNQQVYLYNATLPEENRRAVDHWNCHPEIFPPWKLSGPIFIHTRQTRRRYCMVLVFNYDGNTYSIKG